MPTPPTPPTRPEWTLHNRNIRGGGAGEKLHGCHITTNGTAYEFTGPDIHNVLQSTPGPSLPQIPFTFPVFKYKELEWAITMWTLPEDRNGFGSWTTPGDEGSATEPQSGDFTAQSGGSVDAGKAASHGKS